MAYAVCGNASCIVEEVQRVLDVRRNPATVKPALAGTWGAAQQNRPSLEAQMDALQQSIPQLKTVSHFSFAWQDAEFERTRKSCRPAARSTDLESLRGGVLPESPDQSVVNLQ